MFFLALAPRAEEKGVKVAAHVHLERVHAVDVGVLVPADGGVDLLARPRKACILLSEQLPRPREPLGLKGLHAERPWWPAHADDARDAEPLRVKVDYLEHDDRDSMPADALAVSDEEARHSHLCTARRLLFSHVLNGGARLLGQRTNASYEQDSVRSGEEVSCKTLTQTNQKSKKTDK